MRTSLGLAPVAIWERLSSRLSRMLSADGDRRVTWTGWVGPRWANEIAPYRRPDGAPCPACGAAAGGVTLLTSWTVCYTCLDCDHRWSSNRPQ